MFSEVVGQERVKRILGSALRKGRLAHAYLFFGPEGSGMEAMVVSLARALLCKEKEGGCGLCPTCQRLFRLEHPAFRLILPLPPKPKGMSHERYDGVIWTRLLQWIQEPYREVSFQPEISGIPVIGIDAVRDLKKAMMLKLPEEIERIIAIDRADRLTPAAANSLLKLLEEPPERTILILLTSSQTRLLPTLVSRCQPVRFSPLSDEEIEDALVNRWAYPTPRARFLARMAGGSLGRALSLDQEDFEHRRESAFLLLEKSLESDVETRLTLGDQMVREWDKAGLVTLFQLLRVFLRDWAYLPKGDPERLINHDYRDRLLDLSRRHPGWDPIAGIEAAGRAIDFIGKNAYLPLVVWDWMETMAASTGKMSTGIHGQDIRSRI